MSGFGHQLVRRARNKVRLPLPLFKILNTNKAKFECPICNYEGPFLDFRSFAGFRQHAVCPQCSALERHRLQFLVLKDLIKRFEVTKARVLHFAPEKFLGRKFAQEFPKYETADLYMKGVDHNVDITNLPFDDQSYDVVFASHVLEHVRDDEVAVGEIRRILRPGGLAVLPVPIVCETTIEYPQPNPHESEKPGPIRLTRRVRWVMDRL